MKINSKAKIYKFEEKKQLRRFNKKQNIRKTEHETIISLFAYMSTNFHIKYDSTIKFKRKKQNKLNYTTKLNTDMITEKQFNKFVNTD